MPNHPCSVQSWCSVAQFTAPKRKEVTPCCRNCRAKRYSLGTTNRRKKNMSGISSIFDPHVLSIDKYLYIYIYIKYNSCKTFQTKTFNPIFFNPCRSYNSIYHVPSTGNRTRHFGINCWQWGHQWTKTCTRYPGILFSATKRCGLLQVSGLRNVGNCISSALIGSLVHWPWTLT